MGTKANKHRGRNRYHGRGKKAGRGAGKRGGRGNAGMNKHRVMTRIKYMPGHWGMHGFNRHLLYERTRDLQRQPTEGWQMVRQHQSWRTWY